MKCDYNCSKCKLPDCMNDEITDTEIMEATQRDMSFKNYGFVLNAKPTKGKHRGNRH